MNNGNLSHKISIIIEAVDKTNGLFGKLTKDLKSLESSAPGAANGIDKLTKSSSGVKTLTTAFGGLAAQVGALVSVAAGLKKLVDVSREFDKLSVGLITATGSAEGSQQAFAALQDFATNTPYDLAQVTDSFVKLVNYGLTPSEKALTSYGNTASALAKT